MRPALEFGKIYHIYNRGNNHEKIFYSDNNYHFFLERYQLHISPIADTYAYCLLPNHFHFMVHLKSVEEIERLGKPSKPNRSLKPVRFNSLSQPFANLFNSYTKALNKQTGRTGKLFELPFERIEIDNDSYFTGLVCYIHRNPVHHGYTDNMESWKFSSYAAIAGDKPTKLKKETVLDWFGGKEEFIRFHQEATQDYLENRYKLET